MKHRARLLRIGALVLSIGLGAGYVAYRALAGRQGEVDTMSEGQPGSRRMMPGSKRAEIWTAEDVAPPPAERGPRPFLPGSKSDFIVSPDDVAPAPDPALPNPGAEPEPLRLGPR
jgi:hypothetical protein